MRPKKRFGQNFLINDKISSDIVTYSEIADEVIFEIGPGKGALTKHLLKQAKHVYAFEIDTSFKPILNKLAEENNHFEVIYNDILNIDLHQLIKDKNLTEISCIANIPYNITGPILNKLKDVNEIKKMSLMVQKEVGDRLTAQVNTKAYGQLSVIFNFYYDTKRIVNVKRTNFYPIPKVDSVVVRMDRTDKYIGLVKDLNSFNEFVKAAFTQKRKTLVNNLKSYYQMTNQEVLEKLQTIDKTFEPLTRAEQITINEFIELSNGWYNDWKSICKTKFNAWSYW